MLRKIVGLTLFICSVLSSNVVGQNAIVGTGFSSGWGGGSCPTGSGNFEFMSSSAGSSFIATRNANGTGLQFFRFGIDFSGTTAQRTITIGSDVDITPSQTYNLNSGCTTSGSMRLNVSNTAHNYVFKTLNAGTNPTGTFVVFEVQGAVQTVSSVTQSPISTAVVPGSAVTVTANLSGALSAGQQVYLRYTTNNYSTSTVVAMTGSGTTYTANIPAGTNTASANVSYYAFTSGPSNVAADGSNADLYTINLNNNGGSNYNYTVLSPSFIYNYTNETAGVFNSIAANTTATNLARVNGTSVPGTPCGSGFSTQGFTTSGTYATTEGAVEFRLTPNAGFQANVSAISADLRRSGAGPASVRLAYSLDGGSTWIDRGSNETPNNASCGTTNAASWAVSFNANSTNGVRVRAYGFNSGAGVLQILNFRLTGIIVPLPGPTASLESPMGTTIANGSSRASFGNIVVGTIADFPVRIRNLGGTNTLTVNSISFGGANGSDMSLVTPPAFPFSVAPGGFQDLTVRVAPGSLGARTATMTVASNDASGNASYVINLSATGTASAASDIIDNTTYSSSSPDFNINTQYINFVNNTQNSNDKPVVMKFRIRDGGAGAPDADNLPTSLTAISFTVQNTGGADRSNFIQTAVLTTELGTVLNLTPPTITGGEIRFTGLSAASFSVPDNGSSSSNLHLRVSFVAANVIDNEKLVYQVSSATAAPSGSQFLNASAGGARTDNLTSNDQNRIEVIATRFAFVQQPSNTGFGQTMTPSPSVEAQDANSRRDLDFTGAISLTSTGTMTGSPISVDAVAGLATYSSVVHTVQQTGRQLTASGSVTGSTSNNFDITATSGTTDYFRSRQTGNWSDVNSWESSPDNVTWILATTAPNSSANAIVIRNGHVLSVNSAINLDQLTVSSGATLRLVTGGSIAVFNGTGDDITIESGGIYIHQNNVNAPLLSSGVVWRVQSNATIQVNNNGSGEADYYANNEVAMYTNAMRWENNAVFVWNTTNAFSSVGLVYFSGVTTEIPIFRITASNTVGSNSNTTINGRLEITGSSINLTWSGTGTKTFRNGVLVANSCVLTQNANGQFWITGSTSQLGGPGIINLNADPSAGLVIRSGTNTVVGSVTINGGHFILDAGATVDAGTQVISGNANCTVNSGATIVTAHPNGVNGSINITGPQINFNNGSNYIFNGTVNQTTGTRMADVVGSLTIANTGTAGNNTVTLTDNNTSTNTLNLNSGLFAAGVGQTLEINNTGSVTSTGGEVVTTAAGGNIWLKGNNTVTGYAAGTPHFYDLTIGSGIAGSPVTLVNNPTVHHYCTLNSQAAFTGINAPTYATGSTLIYNTTGAYNRGVEWGSAAGNPGYPWHVLVQNGTTVNLGIGGTPPVLETGGNLTLGNGTTNGLMNMNALAQTLTVKGHLTIGDGTTNGNSLTLSTAPFGDLVVHGNFTRYLNSFYNDNSRAIFFRGSGNSIISTPNVIIPPASSSNPTTQDYGYTIIDKDVATAKVVLNAPVGISEKLTLTKGIIAATSNGLFIKKPTPDGANEGIAGGSADSYVDGKLYRYMSVSTNGLYNFPIGKSDVGAGVFKPVVFTSTNHPVPGSVFSAEYFGGTNATPLPGMSENFLGTLQGVLRDEFWQFNKVSGEPSAAGKLAIRYDYNAGNIFRDSDGTPVAVCTDCNVAVVKRDSDVNPGNWNFTKADYNFDVYDPTYPEARYYNQSGFIQSGEINTFSPFTIGFNFNTILGTLPVKLLAFDGSMQQQQAKLQWQIDSDKDVRYFELQHSSNGNTFTTVNKLNPAGKNYVASHTPGSAGKQFYRLKVVEKNGSSFYSKTIVLIAGNSATFISGLQNSVVTQQVVVNMWLQQNQAVQTSLYNAAGKQLTTQLHQLLRGDNQLTIPTQHLSQGIYFLQVQTADGVRQTFRIFKQ